MNAQYTSKPKEIQNEPNLFGFVRVIPATCPAEAFRRRGKAGIQFLCLYAERYTLNADYKNKPNFFTTKYALSISKTQKWM
jgi:hypothetical protein